MPEQSTETPILIVGAGPVGLTLALSLARFGVRSLVVERHPHVSPHPRARFVHARSMEIFRRLGIEARIRSEAIAPGVADNVVWAPALAAPEVRQVEIETLGPASGEPFSPSPGVCTSQDILDPVLLEELLATGLAEVRFGCRLVGLTQSETGVTARLRSEPAGDESEVTALYAVGADGPKSTVRELVGIQMQGPAALGHSINIHFRADLAHVLRGRSVNMAMILNPAQPGLLLNIDGVTRWTAQAIFVPSAGQGPEEFTEDRCLAVIRTQVGDPALKVELLGAAPWTSAARVAGRLSEGRVFLAGDSAQEMPPAGGFGMNTGIVEADNLAWKLAAVVNGWAAPELLDSYDQECRPLARRVTEEAFNNLRSVGRVEAADGGPPQIKLGRPEFFRERGLVFGTVHASTAVVRDQSNAPELGNTVTDYLPSARPGSRAPHVWLELEGARVSTLDLVGQGFTLFCDQSRDLAATGGAPVRVVVCPDPALLAAYGLEAGGAVLVRPDGHVAWRRAGAGPDAEITAALSAVLAGAREEAPAARM